ncbi:MAG: nucleotidyltransferase domain-containing protein [Pseudomonadota bacterium]
MEDFEAGYGKDCQFIQGTGDLSLLSMDGIKKIRGYAIGRKAVIAFYVFGSTATGKSRPGSDIDLAVMVAGAFSGMERVEMETALSNLLCRDVDLVVFGQATPLLQHQILKYGRLIYDAAPHERILQEVGARRHYLDIAFLYKKIKI